MKIRLMCIEDLTYRNQNIHDLKRIDTKYG